MKTASRQFGCGGGAISFFILFYSAWRSRGLKKNKISIGGFRPRAGYPHPFFFGDLPKLTMLRLCLGTVPWNHSGITLKLVWGHSGVTLGSLWDHLQRVTIEPGLRIVIFFGIRWIREVAKEKRVRGPPPAAGIRQAIFHFFETPGGPRRKK